MPDTLWFAERAHAGQVDKGGKPYVDHVRRVGAEAFTIALHLGLDFQEREDVRDAGFLHDVLEDTATTEQDLRDEGFNENVIRIVKTLTRDKSDGLTYMQWIESIAAGDIAPAIVKLADNLDNSDPDRIAQLPEEQRGVTKRYERSMRILTAAFPQLQPFARS